ncbi:CYFA0S21e01706g1_1 [Cyberlindnera fabianii]|uniref:Nucleolar protein 16 n=1 Tax=Cyberlindnera fabianii TaxID=36022 RepID=A0A061BDV6_CYBFA|nr:CYFA0S21e01706g1_1 [Cyberlindnera fabianii]
MGSVRQHRKAKRSVRKATRRTKDKQREINIASNPIIAANWDYNLTLAQNYKRLGLTARLGTAAGGEEADLNVVRERKPIEEIEKIDVDDKDDDDDDDEIDEWKIPEGEARIVRDDEGNVVKVIYGKKKPLNDDMELVDSPKVEAKTEVVKQLEAYAQSRAGVKQVRKQSEREEAWIQALYEKYGDDYDKMKWDKKLNIYQQSPGDLKKRITRWKKNHNIV